MVRVIGVFSGVAARASRNGKARELCAHGLSFPTELDVCGSPGGTRTPDKAVNSRLLYQLSYRGMALARKAIAVRVTISEVAK